MADNDHDRSQNAAPLADANWLRPSAQNLSSIEPGQTPLKPIGPGRNRKNKQLQGGPNVPQQKETPTGKPIPEKGLGYYPISDLQFDVVTLVFEKSKALQAYDLYIRDSLANPELLKIIEHIAADDRKHIELLKRFLGNC